MRKRRGREVGLGSNPVTGMACCRLLGWRQRDGRGCVRAWAIAGSGTAACVVVWGVNGVRRAMIAGVCIGAPVTWGISGVGGAIRRISGHRDEGERVRPAREDKAQAQQET